MGLSTLYNDEEPIPPMVSAFTRGWGFVDEGISPAAPQSLTYESANRGLWYPIYVPTACVVTRMWWANGVTVSASYNVEAGIYYDGGWKPGGKLITTGSTAQGTASQIQFADITDTRLDVGLFWLYISCSATAATFFQAQFAGSGQWDELVRMYQASVGPGSAPDPADPNESSNNYIHLVGFSTNTVT